MKQMKPNKQLGILITLAGGCLWGLSGACGQFLFSEKNACSDWLGPLRLVTAGFLLTCFYLVRYPDFSRRIWSGKKSALTLIGYGILGMMLCQYSYFKAIEYSNAGTATVLQYLSPVLIMLVMCIREKRLPRGGHCSCPVCLNRHLSSGNPWPNGQSGRFFQGAVLGIVFRFYSRTLQSDSGRADERISHALSAGMGHAHRRRPALYPPQTLAVSSGYGRRIPYLSGRNHPAGYHCLLFPVYAGRQMDWRGKSQSLCLCGTGGCHPFFLFLAPYSIYRNGCGRFFLHYIHPVSDHIVGKKPSDFLMTTDTYSDTQYTNREKTVPPGWLSLCFL